MYWATYFLGSTTRKSTLHCQEDDKEENNESVSMHQIRSPLSLHIIEATHEWHQEDRHSLNQTLARPRGQSDANTMRSMNNTMA